MEEKLLLFVSIFTNELSSLDDNIINNYYNVQLKDATYLDTVKNMGYDDFVYVINCLFSGINNSLLACKEYIGFERNDECYTSYVDEREETYPIEIKQIILDNKQSTIFKGYSPYVVAKHILDKQSSLLFLPLVIESYNTQWEYHQTIFVINLASNTSFLYDPNGYDANDEDIHTVLNRYVSIVNEVLLVLNHTYKPIKYDILKNKMLNFNLPIVGSGNCMICCVLFIFYYVNGYSVEHIDNYLHLHTSKILTQHHIVLYNTIGSLLQ